MRCEKTKICESVKRLRTRAQRHDVEEVVVGIEVLRRLAKTDIYNTSQLAQNVDRILDGRSEAMYSLTAGSFSLARSGTPRGNCLLIDQGFGSMEIAYGTLTEIQEIVSPGDSGGDEGKRLVAGIIPLVYIMNRFGREDFVVSALGTRYGLAFHIGLGHPPSVPTGCRRETQKAEGKVSTPCPTA